MRLLLLHMLVFLPLGKASGHLDDHQSPSALSLELLERSHRELAMANPEEAEDKPDLFVAVPHLVGTGLAEEGRRQREKILSRFGGFWKKTQRDLHPPRDLESEHFPLTTQALPQPKDGMKVEKSPLREEAKRFWQHFMFRKGPASQGVVLPIKSHEVHQETCRTVPFSQTITHEDCENVVVQNNLCFGKCGSVPFPGAAPRPHLFRSHCAPAKFTTMRLRLNCTGPEPVAQVVMQVEECQCRVKTEHGAGHRLHAGSQDPFIPDIST
ncbi:cerberus [Fukomys damarensis]|uniref:Cerberus n=1 Tax=Fukomys damarensis TaxID=885580 RepID=A0A091DE82_FUKDA|nr:cerberus [Fukomys damarensis]XP_019064012.1 cerberus [Fukomys damarensis]KFO30459.1 Cerberus [Fukomys damarensis]